MNFAIEFTPKPRSNLQPIFDRTAFTLPAIREASFQLEAAFSNTVPLSCHQTTWMGRGCFLHVKSSSQIRYPYLAAKGVGPGPGSELMRQRLDKIFQKQHNFSAGCLRLETDTYYPLLVCFHLRDDRWMISNPRPEGFSSFRNLVREFVASALIQQTPIPILPPLILLRDLLPPPWSKETQKGLEEYILPQMPLAISKHLHSRKDELFSACYFPIYQRIYNASYLSLDGGVLIRSAMSPYRVANLHSAAVEEDCSCLRLLREHFTEIHSTRLGSIHQEFKQSIFRYIDLMAKTAADLFSEGIIHGQLHLHYQNVTLAGEIADLDCGIFAMPILYELGQVDYSVSISPQEYDVFWKEIIRLSDDLRTDILSIFRADYDQIGSVSSVKCDKCLLAAHMLQQVYDIYNHALRAVDLLCRADLSTINLPGTILDQEQWHLCSISFQKAFMRNIFARHSQSLLSWCLENGYEYLIQVTLNCLGSQTIYGWSSPDAPLDYSSSVCTELQQQYIHGQVNTLFDQDI